jgi:hypothetical protein
LEENFDRFKSNFHKEKEMVSFRRCILAIAILALFTGLASAQVTGTSAAQLNCSTNVANPTAVRAEGHTELLGDIVITCTSSSSVVPATGIAVTTANITVSLGQNMQVTSRTFGTSGLSEALLLIDEPGSTTATGPGTLLPQVFCATQSTAAGPANAPSSQLVGAGFGGCQTFFSGTSSALCVAPATITGAGCGSIDSTTGAFTPAATFGAVPNVFNGIIPPGIPNQVVFNGIPVLAPGTTASRVFRITNIRADITGLPSANNGTTPVTASVTASNALLLSNPTPIVAFVFQGLNTSQSGPRNAANTSNTSSITGLLQCNTAGLSAGSVLRFTEGFANAFKTRFGSGTGAASTTATIGLPSNQNIPGLALNGSESGFVTIVPGVGTAGLADFGTRLKATFNNIPSGVSLFVSTTNINPLGNSGISINGNVATNTQGLANLLAGGIPTSLNSASLTFLAGLVSSENATGVVGGFLPLQGGSNNGNVTGGVSVPIFGPIQPDANGTATATWEVLLTNPAAVETAEFAVFFTLNGNPATNTPPTSPAGTVALSFAPTTPTAGGTGSPIPRFIPPSTSSTLISVSQCKTVLLFPFVNTDPGFDTGIAVANTTSDPYGTRAQSGACTLNFFGRGVGTTPTAPLPATGTIAAGTWEAVQVSNIKSGFEGYIIAECNFSLGHGYALFSDTGIRNWATGYLGLVLPTAASNRNPQNLVQGPGVAGAVEGVSH